MTRDEDERIIVGVIDEIELDLSDAMAQIIAAIIGGEDPRDAVMRASDRFAGQMEGAVGTALRQILAEAVGEASDVPIVVGTVSLSSRLYAEANDASYVVRGIVQRHADGFQDARALALQLYEGYGFREEGAEPLVLSPRNDRLPRYLRDAVLSEPGLAGSMEREIARLQVDGLSTSALQAAYAEVLDAIDALERGAGRDVLERKLRIAYYERMRYFASRIARTELHKAYAEREARILMDDDAVQFVQVRRAAGRTQPCICALLTGRDVYGLGPGVYPKDRTPVPPFHPFCMCVMAPRLDLSGRVPREADEDADAYFLRRLDQSTAGRVMGSQAKADEVMSGRLSAEDVANASRDPAYRLRVVRDVG